MFNLMSTVVPATTPLTDSSGDFALGLFTGSSPMLLLAEGDAEAGGLFGGFGGFPMILLMLAVFYFIVLRPMKNQEKQRKEKLEALKKNDRVVLNNGIFGRISSLDDKVIMLEVSDKVKIKVKRSEVSDFEENVLKDDDDKDKDKKKDKKDKKDKDKDKKDKEEKADGKDKS
jgi:preprotein translocase subunit YajC